MQVPLSSASNPRLPMLFRVIASVEWLVLGVTGSGITMTVLAAGKLLVQRQGRESWADGSASK